MDNIMEIVYPVGEDEWSLMDLERKW